MYPSNSVCILIQLICSSCHKTLKMGFLSPSYTKGILLLTYSISFVCVYSLACNLLTKCYVLIFTYLPCMFLWNCSISQKNPTPIIGSFIRHRTLSQERTHPHLNLFNCSYTHLLQMSVNILSTCKLFLNSEYDVNKLHLPA